MPNPFITILFCILGATFGALVRKKKPLAMGLGIATGLSLEFGLFIEHWMLVFVLVFGTLTVVLNRKADQNL